MFRNSRLSKLSQKMRLFKSSSYYSTVTQLPIAKIAAKTHFVRCSSVLLCALLAVGCSKGIKPETHEPTPLVGLSQSLNLLSPALSVNLPKGNQNYTSKDVLSLQPAMQGQHIIAATVSGKVSKYQLDGTKVWSVDVEDVITGGVSWDVATATAIITTRSGKVMALDANTGQLRWQKQLNSVVLAPALIGDNRVLLSGNDGVLHGMSLQTGKPIWQYATKTPSISIRGNAAPSLYNNTAFFATADGRIHALDVRTGILIWSRRVGVAVGISEIERINDIDAKPTIKDGQLYAISYSGQLQGIDLVNKKIAFTQKSASLNELVVTDQLVVATTLDGSVVAFNRFTGTKVWQNDALKYRQLSNPVLAGYHIALGDYKGVIHVLNQTTGEIVSRQNSRGAVTHLQVVNNTLVSQNASGNLMLWQW